MCDISSKFRWNPFIAFSMMMLTNRDPENQDNILFPRGYCNIPEMLQIVPCVKSILKTVTVKITSPRTADGKIHVGPVNLLYIIMFKIRKIKPNSGLVQHKPKSFHGDCENFMKIHLSIFPYVANSHGIPRKKWQKNYMQRVDNNIPKMLQIVSCVWPILKISWKSIHPFFHNYSFIYHKSFMVVSFRGIVIFWHLDIKAHRILKRF